MVQEFLNHANQRHRRMMWGLSLIVLVIISLNWISATSSEDETDSGEKSRSEKSLPLFSGRSVQSSTEDSSIPSPLSPQMDQPLRLENDQGIDRYLPEYMQGTEVDGGLSMDEQGNLIVDLNTKRVFDYFLSMEGRISDDQLLELMDLYFRQELVGSAIGQARALFDEYLSYKQALMEFYPGEDKQVSSLNWLEAPSAEMIRSRLQSISLLRRQYLSAAAVEGFFGEQDRYDHVQLQRLDQGVPNQAWQNQEVVHGLKTGSINDDSLYALRQQRYGSDYAERMEAIDEQSRQWQQRLSAYHQQREEILRQDGLSDLDRQSMISQLRKTEFSELEQSRVRASELLTAAE